MEQFTKMQLLAIWLLPVLFAITVHEAAHGWVANKLGDKTALILGRLSFNPIRHIDPLGTVIIPIILVWMSGFIFGWAKPVPVNVRNLKSPRRDIALVAIAGPLSNLMMACIWGCIMWIAAFLVSEGMQSFKLFVYMGSPGILINVYLAALNLLPIPPLDGSRVVSSLLPPSLSYRFEQIAPYGFYILLILLLTGGLNKIMMPLVRPLLNVFNQLFGVSL